MTTIIEASNLFIAVSATAGFAMSIRWLILDQINDGAKKFVQAWCVIMLSVAINSGWFWLSRHIAPSDRIWHPAMYEYRWALLLCTALGFGFGVMKFVAAIEYRSNKMIFAAFCAALVIVYMAELL